MKVFDYFREYKDNLVWSVGPSDFNHYEAEEWANGLGGGDWRLPTKEECVAKRWEEKEFGYLAPNGFCIWIWTSEISLHDKLSAFIYDIRHQIEYCNHRNYGKGIRVFVVR